MVVFKRFSLDRAGCFLGIVINFGYMFCYSIYSPEHIMTSSDYIPVLTNGMANTYYFFGLIFNKK